MQEKVLILDFGSQYTQLIARRVRELNIYCEIQPYHATVQLDDSVKAVILSGSPFSVNEENAPQVELAALRQKPVLGVCYGAQYTAKYYGGNVERSQQREYGKAQLQCSIADDALLAQLEEGSQIWMSHGDSIQQLPAGFEVIATTPHIPVAAFRAKPTATTAPLYGIQFHPEVTHSMQGLTLLRNFLVNIAGCAQDWTPATFIEEAVQDVQRRVGTDKVLLGLSGGVDSSVVALLLHKAISTQLVCFFIDNGLLRKHEYEEVLASYQHLGLNIKGIDAKDRFWSALAGISDPEQKRKTIGRVFIEVFEEAAKAEQDIKWLAQGTIYPDVIESVSVHGPSVTIKSHHNVGGLPEKLHLQLLEPLRMLFKDEVRRVGAALGLVPEILHRHPFPGPGLGIRILGDITPAKVELLQAADHIYIQLLRKHGWYDKVWQAGTILLPIYSVGVMGDERTYEQAVALRAVSSVDGMTAEWSHLPYELLAEISTTIINQVRGINRVVYDISTKPPATIEWE